MPEALGGASHHHDQPFGSARGRPTDGNPPAILLGLPALDELTLSVRQRADAAEAVGIDGHADGVEVDLLHHVGLRGRVAGREQPQPGHKDDGRRPGFRCRPRGDRRRQRVDEKVRRRTGGRLQEEGNEPVYTI